MNAMTLRQYLKDPTRRDALAAALGTSKTVLWHLAAGWRGKRPSAERAIAIEQATNGVVPRWITRPDLWDAPSEQKAA
jgi:DNA-binding transcriptional regulator YdaS (Cro superfamily)